MSEQEEEIQCKPWNQMSYLLLSHFSHVWLCVNPWTATHQAPLSLGFSRQEHWSGLPFPSPVHESEWWKVKVKSLSRVWLLATPWTAAHQDPPSMGFSRQEYWSGLPLPSPRHESEKWKRSRSATPWTAAYQAPLFMGFSRQEYWSGLQLPSPPVCSTKLQLCVSESVCLLISLWHIQHYFIFFHGSHNQNLGQSFLKSISKKTIIWNSKN